MSWQDQGRQEHGWFGHGIGTLDKQAAAPDSGPLFAPAAVAARMRAVVFGAVAALPASARGHSAARPDAAALDLLTGLMAAWARAGTLDGARFATRFFGRAADDPVVGKLREAATLALAARTQAELRVASIALAAAQQRVGLDRWSRFVKEAWQRADQPPGLRSALKSGLDAVLGRLGALNPIGTAQAQKGGPRDGTRRPAGPLSDPLAATRMAAYNTAMARIRQLDPRYATLTKPDFAPGQEALNDAYKTLFETRLRVAGRIANGHGFDKHSWEFGVGTRGDYRDMIVRVLGNPLAKPKTLRDGRIAFYEEDTNTLVLVDPNAYDNGTAYRPNKGMAAFKDLK